MQSCRFITACREQYCNRGEEQHDEYGSIDEKLFTVPAGSLPVLHLIQEPEVSLHTCEEQHHQSEHHHTPIQKNFQSMPVAPLRYDGSRRVGEISLLHSEVAAEEECGHRSAKEQRRKDAVDEKEDVIHPAAKDVSLGSAVFEAHRLHDESEEYKHPYPVGSAEGCGIEQRERCEERSAKGDKHGEGEFPTVRDGIQHSFTLILLHLRYHRLASLHEEHEDQQCA